MAEWKRSERREPFSGKQVRAALDKVIRDAVAGLGNSDEAILENEDFFPDWRSGADYATGAVVRWAGSLYRCVQPHTSQSSWTPDATPALWSRVGAVEDVGDAWPEWIRPTGSHNVYSKGAKVTYHGKHWVSTIDGNVWTPGEYGWEEAT